MLLGSVEAMSTYLPEGSDLDFLSMAQQNSSPINFSTSRLPCCLKQFLIFHKPHSGGVGFDWLQNVGFGGC